MKIRVVAAFEIFRSGLPPFLTMGARVRVGVVCARHNVLSISPLRALSYWLYKGAECVQK